MSGPDLHVHIYTQFVSPKKTGVPPMENTSQNCFDFCYLYFIQLFSADPKIFSKFFHINFLPIKTLKNGPQKLLTIGPNIFFHSPAHGPHPRIDFSYYEISGPDICSLICIYNCKNNGR